MLNRLPQDAGDFQGALVAIGCGDWPAARVARALGVSARTVQRWRKSGQAPRIATLAVWWLTPAGHAVWDAEMQTRTQLALVAARALWAEVGRLRLEAAELRRVSALEGAGHRAGVRQAEPAQCALPLQRSRA